MAIITNMNKIYDYDLNDMINYVNSIGLKDFKARQIYNWLYKKRVADFTLMSDLSKDLIKRLKEEYLEENPQDYEIIGADLMQTFWFATDTATPEDKQIYKVVGEARYHELNNNYKEALRLYEIGNNLFFKAHGAELKEIEREAGKKLAPQVTEQRIEVCKTMIFREKTKKMEKEAKSLEETDPEAAIRLYEELNRLRPGLKKYDKRIKVCKNKLG